MKLKYIGMLLFFLIIACNGSDVTGPEDVNDYDAVYHIMIIDRAGEFNIDLLDFSVPDTLLSTLAPVELEYYWFNLERDSLDLLINIDYPEAHDSLGSLPEANAQMIKFFYGTLEIIGFDTAGGGQERFRLSKEFVIRGEISAQFGKYGSDYNYRRGWLMTGISDVAYAAAYPQGITQITINSASYPELVLSPALKPLADVPVFAPGESVTVTVNGSNPEDIFRLRYPVEGSFQTIRLEPDTNNNFMAEFRLPEAEQYNHFLIEAIGEASFQENGVFRYEGIGVLFKVE